ncbi:hypothetical protein BQ8482_111206 [Mesorhizobium delmotii]|uniref:Uncharacterized protein n=1 Tax=Mesorhizobium delmotii TaxID=1631247 RepID=A0A2P9ADU8_9HYPH|nr:hypothetical protein BQ8482_111206 [Mesorhizobium delmotii]
MLRHRPSLQSLALRRPRPGQAAVLRAVGVRSAWRHWHASRRRRPYEAHRRPAVRRPVPLVGARRRRQPVAHCRAVGSAWRQHPRRARRQSLGRQGQACQIERRAGGACPQDHRRPRHGGGDPQRGARNPVTEGRRQGRVLRRLAYRHTVPTEEDGMKIEVVVDVTALPRRWRPARQPVRNNRPWHQGRGGTTLRRMTAAAKGDRGE